MSAQNGDTLVLRFSEKQSSDDKNESTILYVIYDYNMDNWLIRGNIYKETEFDFSYTCEDQFAVENLLRVLYTWFHRHTIALLTYKDLPLDPDEITFDMLETSYVAKDEYVTRMCTYDYDHSYGERTPADCFYNEKVDYTHYLNILYNFY
jgi:hypothetical protein